MAVYVDPLFQHQTDFGRRMGRSCHLYADTVLELHAVAVTIGLPQRAFQSGRFPHYDLDSTLRLRATRTGVIEHTRKAAVLFWRKQGWTRRTTSRSEPSDCRCI